MRRTLWTVVLCTVLAALPGCTAFVADAPFFKGNDVNLLAVDYAAADMLAHSAKGVLKPGTPVRVGILVDAYGNGGNPAKADNHANDFQGMPVTPVVARSLTPAASSAAPDMPVPVTLKPMPVVHIPGPFGKVVIEQIAGRWVDLGFHVVGGSGLARPGQAVLGGQYARADGKVLINLRLKDAASGRILAVYDYSMPISREINDLLGDDGQQQGLFKW